MKKKPMAQRLKGTPIGVLIQSKAGVVLSNWIFQGMRQMNAYEIGLKFMIDISLAAFFLILSSAWVPISFVSVFIFVGFAHTVNWIINGHIYVLMRYVRPVPQSLDRFELYIEKLWRRGKSRKRLDGVAVFGSYCMGRLNENSDLDVRFIVLHGVINSIFGALYCFCERLAALINGFPLDIYCVVENIGLDVLSEDENPVVLIDKSGFLAKRYPKGIIKKFDKNENSYSNDMKAGKRTVCIVCSAGGHLAEALAVVGLVEAPRYFVTFDEPHVRSRLVGEETYYVVDPHVSPLLYMKNAWQSSMIFLRKRPKVVVSTGAGIALFTCLLAKFAGSTLIFVETGARVTTPSRTGKMIYPIADLFIVQWKPLLKHYPKAIHGGALL